MVGDLTADLGIRDRLFLATKVWTSGREAGIRQMEDSFRLMRTKRMDLMQVHNLLDLDTHLKTLREWKAAGKIRYLGITHYHSGAYAELETTDQDQRIRFRAVQLFDGRARSRSAAAAVVCRQRHRGASSTARSRRPGCSRKVRGRPLPPWAAEFDCASWAQFFLKYILAHPAVTCVIPGTRRVAHLQGQSAGRRRPAARRGNAPPHGRIPAVL